MEYLRKWRYGYRLDFVGFKVRGFKWYKFLVCGVIGHKINRYSVAVYNDAPFEFCVRCRGMVRR